MMHVSEVGRKLIKLREGEKLHAYQDQRGIWTIGVGHTASAGAPIPHQGMIITSEECDRILERDLYDIELAVSSEVACKLTQYEFDALVSLVFNIGKENFRISKTLRYLNAGKKKAAGKAIMGWCKPKELTSRRRAEMQQFFGGALQARVE